MTTFIEVSVSNNYPLKKWVKKIQTAGYNEARTEFSNVRTNSLEHWTAIRVTDLRLDVPKFAEFKFPTL